jgi:hypothetical protein
MAAEKNTTGILVTVALSLIGLLFIGLGVYLIYSSHQVYQQSVDITLGALKNTRGLSNAGQVPSYTSIKDGYGQALFYFILALGCIVLVLLLPRIQTFSIGPGGVNVTLQALQQTVNALATQGNGQAASSAGAGGIPAPGAAMVKAVLPAVSADPQKGKWGGKAINNGRMLSAQVTPAAIKGYFKVYIRVESIDPAEPLNGVVQFHLHPSFDNPNPVITVQQGVALLNLKKAVGHFTLGAECDNSATKLELDLTSLPGLPPGF